MSCARVCVGASVLAAAMASGVQAAALYADVNAVFDPAGGGSVNQGVVSNEAGLTLSAWQSRIGAAYAAGNGGVWNSATLAPGMAFVDTSSNYSSANGTPANLTISAGKTIAIGAIAAGANGLYVGQYASAAAVSGNGCISSYDQADANWGMSFGLGGFAGGARISEIAFANIGRSGTVGNNVSFTVVYTDDSTASTGNLSPLLQNNARLVHFVAPAGLGIKQLDMAIDGTRGIQLDDLSFIVTVPEPASLVAIGAAGLLLMRRRGE